MIVVIAVKVLYFKVYLAILYSVTFLDFVMRGWSYNVLYVYRRTTSANDDDEDWQNAGVIEAQFGTDGDAGAPNVAIQNHHFLV